MGEQRSTASGPMASKARDSLLCTLLLWAELCVVGCWAGHQKGEGGRTGKTMERGLGRCRDIPEHHVGCNTCHWIADLTSLGEGNGHRRVC